AIGKIPRPDNLTGDICKVDDLALAKIEHESRCLLSHEECRFCVGIHLVVPLVRRCLIGSRRREYGSIIDEDIETSKSAGDVAKHLFHCKSVRKLALEKRAIGSGIPNHLQRLLCLTLAGPVVNSNARLSLT